VASREIAGVWPLTAPSTHLCADRICRTPRCSFKSTADHRLKVAWLAHANQAAHGSFCIASGRIDENACHGSLFVCRNEQPLAKCCGTVPALERKAVHQQVSQSMQEDEAWDDRLNGLSSGSLHVSVPGIEAPYSLNNLRQPFPFANQGLAQLKKESFSINQVGWKPRFRDWIASEETHFFLWRSSCVWENPGEAD
jgi:hypothetical protein